MSTRTTATRLIKTAAARVNVSMSRRDLTHAGRRAAAIRHHGIRSVLDVGANRGQYCQEIREFGYTGDIVSFEPIPDVMRALRGARAQDSRWSGVEVGLGDRSGTAVFHVSQDSVTSSFLAARDELTARISTASEERSIEVRTDTLDNWLKENSRIDPESALLKIDVQGFEHQVLDGATASLPRIPILEIEMGLVELYDGGSTIHDLLPRSREVGFGVVSIEPGFVDTSTGQVLDVTMLLARR